MTTLDDLLVLITKAIKQFDERITALETQWWSLAPGISHGNTPEYANCAICGEQPVVRPYQFGVFCFVQCSDCTIEIRGQSKSASIAMWNAAMGALKNASPD